MELLNNSMGVATIMFHTLDFSAHLNWWYNSSNGLSRGIQIVVRLYFLCYSCTEVIAKVRGPWKPEEDNTSSINVNFEVWSMTLRRNKFILTLLSVYV